METTVQPPRAAAARIGALLALPVLGIGLLLVVPSIDGRWAHDPSHLWLVLAAAVLTGALAYATGVAAERRSDARVALVSLAFLTCSGFLGLHALATPRVLLDGANAGFVIATPVGLALAGALAAASALVPDSGPPPGRRASSRGCAGASSAVLALWAAVSLAEVPPLDIADLPTRGSPVAVAVATAGLGLYALALVRYVALFLRRPTGMLLGLIIGLALLAEATLATALAPQWHASWWGWHLLILAASVDRRGHRPHPVARGALRRPLPRLHRRGHARPDRAVRRPAGLHAVLGGQPARRGLADAQPLPRRRRPGDRPPARRRRSTASWATR